MIDKKRQTGSGNPCTGSRELVSSRPVAPSAESRSSLFRGKIIRKLETTMDVRYSPFSSSNDFRCRYAGSTDRISLGGFQSFPLIVSMLMSIVCLRAGRPWLFFQAIFLANRSRFSQGDELETVEKQSRYLSLFQQVKNPRPHPPEV